MTTQFAYERKEVLLDIANVSVSYGGTAVLKNFSAQIHDIVRPGIQQGQVVGLLGPSGVGKSTLFRVLAGLLIPDEGTVSVGPGRVPASPGLVGVVAQNYILLDHRTILANLTIAGKQAGLAGREARDTALKYLESFGLSEHAEKYPIQLSGGQRQRVAIAQQLICSDHYLVMDEPFSGLDVVALENVQHMLGDVATRHEENTLVLVTHDVTSAVAVCDTIWLMGRDRDADGHVIPGARIMETFDLIEMDLCWHPDILTRPACTDLIQRIKARFRTL